MVNGAFHFKNLTTVSSALMVGDAECFLGVASGCILQSNTKRMGSGWQTSQVVYLLSVLDSCGPIEARLRAARQAAENNTVSDGDLV